MTLFYPIANLTDENLEREKTFNLLLSPENPNLNISLSETQVARLQMTNSYWLVGIRWLYRKKYNPKLQILGRKKDEKLFAKLLEPFGDWLLAIFNLCSELSLIDNLLASSLPNRPYLYSSEYKNPLVRFEAICLEVKKQDYLDSLSLVPTPTKEGNIKDIRQILKNLREWINPISRDKEPHFWKLIQDCLKIEDMGELKDKKTCFPEFVRVYWNGKNTLHPSFLVAYARLAAAFEKRHFQQATIEADNRTSDGQKIKVRGGDEIFL